MFFFLQTYTKKFPSVIWDFAVYPLYSHCLTMKHTTQFVKSLQLRAKKTRELVSNILITPDTCRDVSDLNSYQNSYQIKKNWFNILLNWRILWTEAQNWQIQKKNTHTWIFHQPRWPLFLYKHTSLVLLSQKHSIFFD